MGATFLVPEQVLKEIPMLTVAAIMTEDVCTIASTASVAEAIQLMQARQVRSLIVDRRQPDLPYGIVTERDVVYKVIARGHNPSRVSVHDIMRQPCIAVDPDMNLAELAQLFSDSGIQRAPVMRHDQLLGVVSVTDIVMRGVRPMAQPAGVAS
jgi:CBS domain-containing protein